MSQIFFINIQEYFKGALFLNEREQIGRFLNAPSFTVENSDHLNFTGNLDNKVKHLVVVFFDQ